MKISIKKTEEVEITFPHYAKNTSGFVRIDSESSGVELYMPNGIIPGVYGLTSIEKISKALSEYSEPCTADEFAIAVVRFEQVGLEAIEGMRKELAIKMELFNTILEIKSQAA